MRSFQLNNKIKLGNSLELMEKLPDNSVDAVITDPPFGIDFKATKANYNRDDSKVLKGYREIKVKNYAEFTNVWMREAERVLKPNGTMMIVSGFNNMNIILNCATFRFELINQIIWKFQFGVYTKNKFVTSHYNIFYFKKPGAKVKFYDDIKDTKLSYKERESVWTIAREYWPGDKTTPTKLPLELCKKMIRYTTRPGDIILDPFAGSGQVAYTAKLMKRKYVTFEIVKAYYDFAAVRLKTGKYKP